MLNRSCIGQALAEHELFLFLAGILSRYFCVNFGIVFPTNINEKH